MSDLQDTTEISSRVYRAQTGIENEHGARVEAGDIIPLGFVPAWQLQYWLSQGDVTMTEAIVIDASDGVNAAEASAASEVLHQRRKQKRGEP